MKKNSQIKRKQSLNEAEELIEQRRTEFSNEIKELHSRITTNTKEIMSIASKQHKEHSEAIQKLHTDINKRVGVLEKYVMFLLVVQSL